MPLLIDLPPHILVRAIAVALAVPLFLGWVVGLFTRRKRD